MGSLQDLNRVRIIVHGGAWNIPDEKVKASRAGVEHAARRGYLALLRGQSAVDAVEEAVKVMENDEAFDAGIGSCLNSIGEVELDAMIMSGTDLKCGAVAGVQSVQNPVSLARAVMEKSQHCFLVGKGADSFAREQDFPEISRNQLVSASAIEEFEHFTNFPSVVEGLFQNGHDTVGCVAMDADGNLAAATSTGGITFKRPGRVGDSPIVGCGCYCDFELGGVSCTGHGESIMRVLLARSILSDLNAPHCCSASEACSRSLQMMKSRVNGFGGAIVISPSGEIGSAFTTERMAWVSIEPTEDLDQFNSDPHSARLCCGIEPGQKEVSQVKFYLDS